jgi:hypothetical protein
MKIKHNQKDKINVIKNTIYNLKINLLIPKKIKTRPEGLGNMDLMFAFYITDLSETGTLNI